MTSTQNSRMDLLRDLCERFRVSSLYVFGTDSEEPPERVNENGDQPALAVPSIEVAITAVAASGLSNRQRDQLCIELARLFEVDRANLTMLWEADPYLAVDIVRGKLLYCADPGEQARDELYVLGRAADASILKKKSQSDIEGETLESEPVAWGRR